MTRRSTPRRVPGQTIECGWCRKPIEVQSTGRLPKWCSASCRHRAWEQRRATSSDRRPVEVVDRVVTVEVEKLVRVVQKVRVEVSTTGRGWHQQLEELTRQIDAGRVYDRDLLDLAAVLEAALLAVEKRPAWQQLLRRRALADQRWGPYRHG